MSNKKDLNDALKDLNVNKDEVNALANKVFNELEKDGYNSIPDDALLTSEGKEKLKDFIFYNVAHDVIKNQVDNKVDVEKAFVKESKMDNLDEAIQKKSGDLTWIIQHYGSRVSDDSLIEEFAYRTDHYTNQKKEEIYDSLLDSEHVVLKSDDDEKILKEFLNDQVLKGKITRNTTVSSGLLKEVAEDYKGFSDKVKYEESPEYKQSLNDMFG